MVCASIPSKTHVEIGGWDTEGLGQVEKHDQVCFVSGSLLPASQPCAVCRGRPSVLSVFPDSKHPYTDFSVALYFPKRAAIVRSELSPASTM